MFIKINKNHQKVKFNQKKKNTRLQILANFGLEISISRTSWSLGLRGGLACGHYSLCLTSGMLTRSHTRPGSLWTRSRAISCSNLNKIKQFWSHWNRNSKTYNRMKFDETCSVISGFVQRTLSGFLFFIDFSLFTR